MQTHLDGWAADNEVQTLARAPGTRGEVVLRRRRNADGDVDELIVNGAFAMDSTDTSTERELARLALSHSAPGGSLLIGGLGLGYTAYEALDLPVGRIDVVELEPGLVQWAQEGLTAVLACLASEPRVSLLVGDIAEALRHPGQTWDAIILDVDNGPDFLIHAENAALYGSPLLSSAYARLSPGGRLAIWCQGPCPTLMDTLSGIASGAQEHLYQVSRGRQHFSYAIYTLDRPAAGPRWRVGHNGPMSEATSDGFRIEHDTMGEVRVPAEALYKAQTQRAVENFPISGLPIDPALIAALARIKGAAARANANLGVLEQEMADAIVQAAAKVAGGDHDADFPIDVFQTGSGTSSNMNANEVVASLASVLLGRPVHPNDHVNASQSSNDVFPSAIHIAATDSLATALIPALQHLDDSLSAKAEEFAEVVKSGRTHLMDATPVTLGQEFGGYAAQVRYGIERIEAALPRVAELPLGGTAVGTGINTPAGFAASVIALVAEETGLPLTEARNHFEAQGARDALVEASGALRTVAVSLTKIANDLRWMGSGPRAGLGEIALPDLQPGSSIMPGKVNPVLAEATVMVCAQVIGNDTTITFAGAAGNFELNVMLPVIARNLLESIRLLANVSRLLADRCVNGIVANVDHCRTLAESSPSIVTPLNRYLGYENAAAVAKQALKQGRTIREVVIESGFVADGKLTEPQLDQALDVLAMTRRPS